MRTRILCPKHKEDTPSCVIYEDRYRCFGCGASGSVKDLKGIEYESSQTMEYTEDLGSSLASIRSLPLRPVRGLHLPSDTNSFYILWPEGDYYKRRYFATDASRGKYRCPSGVSKPVFALYSKNHYRTAIVVEGELNALSLWEACKDYDIICPGGTGDFTSKNFQRKLGEFRRYGRVLIVADKDAPGATAAIKLKAALLTYLHDVGIELMEQDANDVLQKEGPEALRQKVKDWLGVPRGVSGNTDPVPTS